MSTNPNMEAIETITVGAGGAASIEFINIPQTYTDLYLLVSIREESSTASVAFIKFNNATANRSERYLQGNGSSAVSGTTSVLQFIVCQPTDTANTFGNASIYIPNYASSNYKSVSSDSVSENNAAGAFSRLVAGLWSDTSAINQITITTDTGDVAQHSSATLYGITNAAVGAKATGGIISETDTHYIHTFTASGTFTPSQNLTADYLVVAGGGAGGPWYGGAGGGGGLRSTVTATGGGGSLETALSLTAGTSYTATVGAGGAGVSFGTANSGNNSVFSTITSTGGGRGGGFTSSAYIAGASGGSGGGGGAGSPFGGGTGTANQGRDGGSGEGSESVTGGGGGGANTAGQAGGTDSDAKGGNGGAGVATSITGSSVTYAGGGGGQTSSTSSGNVGAGGAGGGGAGAFKISNGFSSQPENGTANTGGGGGGCSDNSSGSITSGNGGSGIVIVRYAK